MEKAYHNHCGDEELNKMEKAKRSRGRPRADKKQLRKEIRKAGMTFSRSITGTNSTCMISLPAPWIRLMDLKRGNELLAIIHGNDFGFIAVVPPREDLFSLGKATIRISPEEEKALTEEGEDSLVLRMISRKVVAAYLRGYDEIYVRMNEKNHKIPQVLEERMKELALKLFGVQAMPSSQEEIHLWMSSAYRDCKEIFTTMYRYVSEMCSNLEKILTKFDPVLAEDLIRTDDIVDGWYHFIVRNLKMAARNPYAMYQMIGIENYRELMAYRLVARSNERIADHCVKMAETLLGLDTDQDQRERWSRLEFGQEISNLCAESMGILKSMMNAFLNQEELQTKFDRANRAIARAEELEKERREILKSIVETRERISPQEFWVQRLVIESMRRIVDYAVTIGELTLNLHIDWIV